MKEFSLAYRPGWSLFFFYVHSGTCDSLHVFFRLRLLDAVFPCTPSFFFSVPAYSPPCGTLLSHLAAFARRSRAEVLCVFSGRLLFFDPSLLVMISFPPKGTLLPLAVRTIENHSISHPEGLLFSEHPPSFYFRCILSPVDQ